MGYKCVSSSLPSIPFTFKLPDHFSESIFVLLDPGVIFTRSQGWFARADNLKFASCLPLFAVNCCAQSETNCRLQCVGSNMRKPRLQECVVFCRKGQREAKPFDFLALASGRRPWFCVLMLASFRRVSSGICVSGSSVGMIVGFHIPPASDNDFTVTALIGERSAARLQSSRTRTFSASNADNGVKSSSFGHQKSLRPFSAETFSKAKDHALVAP